MSSRRQKKRQRARRKAPGPADSVAASPHLEAAVESIEAVFEDISRFAESADPAAAIKDALVAAITNLSAGLSDVEPARIIEVARLACLPWGPAGNPDVNANSAAARAELVALVALAAASATAPGGPPESHDTTGSPAEGVQPLTDLLNGRLLGEVENLLRLAQLRDMTLADPGDPLTYIAAMVRGSEIWIRNTSYPDMVEATVLRLFADADVQRALQSRLGFDANHALLVLRACDKIQLDRLNARMVRMRDTTIEAMRSGRQDAPQPEALTAARAAWTAAWEPETEDLVVTADELAAACELPVDTVRLVVNFFKLHLGSATPADVVDEFTRGSNPLRTHPLVPVGDDVMLVHDAQILGAIRENFEQYLKTSPIWDRYQSSRGHLLEERTRAAVASILPDAHFRNGFMYYVPASPEQENLPPERYTKRVEGDHLVIQDDLALIIEDKAVAVSPTAREGETRKLRRDLTGIVTKAAEQAGRLRNRILLDGGVRVHEEGWIDLSHIREIHTIAVSLDDLMGVSTATAHLARAGLIGSDNIPWTVSIHDLDLIAQLVDHPAEFLLYLRRRRNAESTVLFTAPDELDLFLHFFARGLWVEPDPKKMRMSFPFLPDVSTSEQKRWERQAPAYITSHTDDLDRWHYAQVALAKSTVDDEAVSEAPRKPAMLPSPLRPLMDLLRNRGDYGWLSISATLLAGSTAHQRKAARIPRDLLRNPSASGLERSLTMPFLETADVADGWLMVWATEPVGRNREAYEQHMRTYLRAKKYQMGLPRGVVFSYSEQSKELVGVYFDDNSGPLDNKSAESLKFLRPPNSYRASTRLPRNKRAEPRRRP